MREKDGTVTETGVDKNRFGYTLHLNSKTNRGENVAGVNETVEILVEFTTAMAKGLIQRLIEQGAMSRGEINKWFDEREQSRQGGN